MSLDENSPAPRTERLARRLAATVLILTVLLAAAVAVIIAQGAANQAKQTANCVNTILGVRAPLTEADHANERQKIEDQIAAERDESRGLAVLATAKTSSAGLAGFRLYERGVAEFVKALDDWKTRDDAIAAAKRAHPLGKC